MHSEPPINALALISAAPFLGSVRIDGLVPGGVVSPSTGAEVAAVIEECARRNFAVAPVGSGSALTLGNLPERLDLALSTSRLGGVIDYEPSDLVISVGAGAKLADIQAVLAEHGQTLPVDPPNGREATIGGLIATGLTGPNRLGNGSLRDLLIGISVAHPGGTLTHAGGMVVKNVSGYDLPRVYHGSLGTLGIVVSANFKVLPLPQREASIVSIFTALSPANTAAEAILESNLDPVALEVIRQNQDWLLAARFHGRGQGSAKRAALANDLIRSDSRILEDLTSRDWWTAYADQARLDPEPTAALLRCTVRPRDVHAFAANALEVLSQPVVNLLHTGISPGLGTVTVRIQPAEEPARETLARVRDRLIGLGGACLVLSAPPDWKRGLDVWGATPATLEEMKAIKHQFDPKRVLNPGRFAGFI